MAQLRIVMTADEARAFRAYQKMLDKEKQLGRASEETGRKSRKGMQESEGALSRMGGQLTNYITGLAGVGGVLMLWQKINSEIQTATERQQRFAQTQISAESAEKSLIWALGGKRTDEEIRGIIGEFDEIAAETGANRDAIMRAAANAVSAASGDVAVAIDAVRVSARLAPEDPETMGALAGAAIDLRKTRGGDATENIGWARQVGEQARVSELSQQARVLPGALANMAVYGATPEEGAALWASLTSVVSDPSGKRQASGAIGFVQQLQGFIEGNKQLSRIVDEQYGGLEAMTAFQRVNLIKEYPRLTKEFVAGLSLEKAVAGSIEKMMLFDESPLRTAIIQAWDAIPTAEEARALGEKAIADMDLATGSRVAKVARAGSAARTQIQLSDEGPAIVDQIVGTIEGVAADTGLDSALGQGIRNRLLGMLRVSSSQEDMLTTAITILQNKSKEIQREPLPWWRRLAEGMSTPPGVARTEQPLEGRIRERDELTVGEARMVEAIDSLTGMFGEMLAEVRQNTAVMQAQTQLVQMQTMALRAGSPIGQARPLAAQVE